MSYEFYEKMPPIAPKGVSALRCTGCGTYLTPAHVGYLTRQHKTRCKICGASHRLSTMQGLEASISESCTQFWYVDAVFYSVWHHFSTSEFNNPASWLSSVIEDDVPVHVGTYRSSSTLQRWHKRRIRSSHLPPVNGIWRMRIKPEAIMHPKVAKDYSAWDTGVPDGYDVLRYLNVWESPGQISLLVNPRMLTLDTRL